MSNLSGFVKRLRDIMRNDAGINGDAQRIEQIAWMLFLKVYDSKEQDWEFDDDNYTSIIPEACRWQNWAHDDKSGSALTGDQLLDFVNNTLFPVLKGKDIKDSEGNVIIEGIKVTAETPIKKAIVQTTFADANQYMKDGVLLRQVINVIDELDLSDYEESHAFGEIYESILKELQGAGSAGEFYTPRAVTDFMAQMIQPKIGETMADFACGTGGFITSWLKVLQKQVQNTADAKKYSESIYGIEKKQFPYMLCITNLLLHGLDIPRVFHDNTLLKDVLDYTVDDQFDVILMNPPYGGSEKADVKNHFPSDLASSETADLFMSVIMYRLKKNGRAAVILPDSFLRGLDNTKIAIKKKLLKEFNLHTIIRMPSSVFSPYTSITTNILFFDNTKPTEETWFYRLDMPSDRKHFSKTKPMELIHFEPVVEWWDNRREIVLDGYDKAKKCTVTQLIDQYEFEWKICEYPFKEEVILSPNELIQFYQQERATLNAIANKAISSIATALSTEEVVECTESANGVLKKLSEIDSSFPDNMRKSILYLAVQGKLVEQRMEDGTGEELLQFIQSEQRIACTKKKAKNTSCEIKDEEIPFDIPETWKWVHFNQIATSNLGKTLDKVKNTGEVCPYLCSINVYWKGIDLSKVKEARFEENEREKYLLKKGDLLVCEGGDCGRAAIWNEDQVMYYQNALHRIRFYGDINPVFYRYVLELYKLSGIIERYSKGDTIKHLVQNALYAMWIPLPPLAEQKRIVAKLEEILPLCERLK